LLFTEMAEEKHKSLRKEKMDLLKQQGRYERRCFSPDARETAADNLVMMDLARTEMPPYEESLLASPIAD
jgi:hypothetical protein